MNKPSPFELNNLFICGSHGESILHMPFFLGQSFSTGPTGHPVPRATVKRMVVRRFSIAAPFVGGHVRCFGGTKCLARVPNTREVGRETFFSYSCCPYHFGRLAFTLASSYR